VSPADPEGQDSAPDTSSEAAPSPSSGDLAAPGVMLAKEQQTGYMTAGAVGVIVIILGITRQVHNSHSDSLLAAGVGVAGAIALAYAVHRGRRIFAAIVSIVGGLALSGFFPLNFIFLAYGGYLMFLQSRAQKKLNKAGVRRTRPPPRTRKDGTTRGRRGEPPPATNRPKANRRYTPPKSAKTTKRTR
jgi:hypothetical protein